MLGIIKKEWRYLIITPLFFTTLLTAHVKRYEIIFLSPEVMVSYLVLFFVGLIPGLVMVFGGKWLRKITIVSILTLYIMMQLNVLDPLRTCHNWQLTPLFLVIFYALISYAVSKKLKIDQILLVFFGVLWIGAFLVSATPGIISEQFFSSKNVYNKNLPPYIEIILDEHIGIDGAGIDDDKNGVLDAIRSNYIHRGFRIYSKAYSREVKTIASFSSFLNFKLIDGLDSYLSVSVKGASNKIIHNTLFETLTKRGYLINVMQSRYLDFCSNRKNINLRSCLTYDHNNTNTNTNTYITTLSRSLSGRVALMIAAMIRGLHMDYLASKFFGSQFLVLIRPNVSTPVSSYNIFLKTIDLAKNIKSGNAYFIHILSPHAPYILDKKCKISSEHIMDHDHMDSYFDQVQCAQHMINQFLSALQKNTQAEDSEVVIHGDHGYRGSGVCLYPGADCSSGTMIKNFSTLFAVRSPLYKPGNDVSQLPLDFLLKNIVLHRNINRYDCQEKNVNLRESRSLILRSALQMPLF